MREVCRRLRALDMQDIWRLAAAAGAPDGLTAADVLDEARWFFRLPLAAPLAEIDAMEERLRTAAGLTEDDKADVKQTLTRYDRPVDRCVMTPHVGVSPYMQRMHGDAM
jgi:hypothetical protein